MIRLMAALVLIAAAWTGSTAEADAQTMASPMPAAAMPVRSIHIIVNGDAIAGLPRRSLTVAEEHGGSATYSGVDLAALLARAGAPAGTAIRGAALAAYVMVRGADGYRVIFALPELDPAFTDRTVLLADQRDGAALSPQLGPYRIVVPGEKRAARWVRNVTEIDLEPIP